MRTTKLRAVALAAALALTITACGANEMGRSDGARSTVSKPASGMSGDSGMASMLEKNGRYSDRLFIDNMVPHHAAAVKMAEVALKNADHQEVKTLARNIIRTQSSEIRELKDIKKREYGTSNVPERMSSGQMYEMGMTMDSRRLAGQHPFDRAFIDDMIPHHRSAIEMAEMALKDSENPRVRKLAKNIVSGQEKEVSRMREWRSEWYPEG